MVFATSPAHTPAREARARIDAVAATIRASGARIDRKGIADRLARAAAALYAVIDTGVEAPAHHDGLVECARVLAEARHMLPPDDPTLSPAIAELDVISARLSKTAEEIVDLLLAQRGRTARAPGADGASPARPFQASVGVPRLHALARAPVPPRVSLDAPDGVERRRRPAPPPPPKPKTIAELRAAAREASAPKPPPEPEVEPEVPAPRPPAPDEGEILRRVARDCLEDVASLRGLRKPIPTETWLDQAPFEQRLLDNVDAFVALGEPALPSVTLFHAEAPAPDPARGFAVALVLGCIEGTDTVDVAIATMKQSAPEELGGFAEGFALAPSPAIDAEIARLLDEPNPALVGVALDVLGARGSLPADAAERVLARRDPSLTLRLASALGRAGPKTTAVAVLTRLLDEAPDDALFEVACTALLRRGDGGVRQRLRDALARRSSPATVACAARLLAIGGRLDDAPLLVGAIASSPSPDAVRALGRHGHADALPALAALLDTKDEAVVEAAAEALDFMTNAGLREERQEPWSPEAPPDGSPPPTRAVSKPVVDRLRWEAWLARVRPRLDPRLKLRAGAPFVPAMICDELESPATPPARRADAAFELVVATGVGARLSTTDWVARQRRQLAEIREHVRSLGGSPGSYWYAGAAATPTSR